MSAIICCDNCEKRFRVKEEMLGRRVRCPNCKEPFVARDQDEVEEIEEVTPKPRAKPKPKPVTKSAPKPKARQRSAASTTKDDFDFATASSKRERSRRARAEDDEHEYDNDDEYEYDDRDKRDRGETDFEFQMQVVKDTRKKKKIKGNYKARITPRGLRLKQGKKDEIVIRPGDFIELENEKRVIVEIDGYDVTLAVTGVTVYQKRLAADLVDFINGDLKVMYKEDYAVPAILYVLAGLPIGIPIVTLGGAIPGMVGGGLAAGGFAIAQQEKIPFGTRLLFLILLSVIGYAAIGIIYLVKEEWLE